MATLPDPATETAALELGEAELDDLRARSAVDRLAPRDQETLLRYLVYLGAGYVEADDVIVHAGDAKAAYDELYQRYSRTGAARGPLRFRFSEASNLHLAQERAHAAHRARLHSYTRLVERLRGEIETRGRRVANLEEQLP